jgi:hypothetical protein
MGLIRCGNCQPDREVHTGELSLLAPIPRMHLDGAIEILNENLFALFGTETYDFFRDVEEGAKVLMVTHPEKAGKGDRLIFAVRK